MEMRVDTAKRELEGVTDMLKMLEKFVFKETDWTETLSENTKIGRRLLMAVKEHSRPD